MEEKELFVFLLTKNNTASSPKVFLVNSSIVYSRLYFRCHQFKIIMIKSFPNLVNSSWSW